MNLLVDLNIWVDLLLRVDHFPKSREFYQKTMSSHYNLYFPLSGYTTFLYLGQKFLKREKASQEFLRCLYQDGVLMAPFTQKEWLFSHKLQLKDLEDACILAQAISVNADYIVTKNIKDYKNSIIPAEKPDFFIK